MKKIGLVLSGGGARGLAHIGVIKALSENDIPIDLIVGASAGSLIGGLYAVLGSVREIEKISQNFKYKDLARIVGDIGSTHGIIRGVKLESELKIHCKDKNIDSLAIPFFAVATDLSTGNEYVIREGAVSTAIRASCAIPGLFESVKYKDRLLVDGAVSSPVPVRAAKNLGADIVVAVNLYSYSFINEQVAIDKKPGISSIGMAAIDIMQFNMSKDPCNEADVVIIPDVSSIPWLDFRHFVNGKSVIEKGYQSALKNISRIKEVIS